MVTSTAPPPARFHYQPTKRSSTQMMNQFIHLHLPMLLLLTISLTTPTTAQWQNPSTYICDTPTNGCTNGMWNGDKCICDCIAPFCHDAHGDCTLPNNCNTNPWGGCQPGSNCPWWKNPLVSSKCTTGREVPSGTWDIYSTRRECCTDSYPLLVGSQLNRICDVNPGEEVASAPPTKYPTISNEGDKFEVVPLRFDIRGLPDDIDMASLRTETEIALKRILIRLSERIEGLKISDVEERIVPRNMKRVLQLSSLQSLRHQRVLEKDVKLFYNIYVVRDDDKSFGPIIIDEMRERYSEVVDQIQTSPNINWFEDNVELNFCTTQGGQYSNCVYNDSSPASSPSTITVPSAPTTIYGQPVVGPSPAVNSYSDGNDDPGGGLAGWAIAIIILVVLAVLCCVGYAIFVVVFSDRDQEGDGSTKIQNNLMLFGNKSRGGPRNESYYDESHDVKSRGRSTGSFTEIYGKSRSADGAASTMKKPKDEPSGKTSGTSKKSKATKTRVAKDPTMYVPGQDQKPDPDSGIHHSSSLKSTRKHNEDPPLKPKKDPTMWVEGQRDPSAYFDTKSSNRYMEDPPLKPKRDPTQYLDGQGREPQVSFRDEASSVGRDPTIYSSYEYCESVRTEEPPASVDSSKRSKKSKKKSSYL